MSLTFDDEFAYLDTPEGMEKFMAERELNILRIQNPHIEVGYIVAQNQASQMHKIHKKHEHLTAKCPCKNINVKITNCKKPSKKRWQKKVIVECLEKSKYGSEARHYILDKMIN